MIGDVTDGCKERRLSTGEGGPALIVPARERGGEREQSPPSAFPGALGLRLEVPRGC